MAFEISPNGSNAQCSEASKSGPELRAARNMETIAIGTSELRASRIALGTWAIGGWRWGGNSDLDESVATMRSAIERGITLIDGHRSTDSAVRKRSSAWRSREACATAQSLRRRSASNGKAKVRRNSSPARIRQEIKQSLRRLRTDYIDLYQVHWPDPLVPIQETAAALARLLKEGQIRAIGVSNYSPEQMAEFGKAAPIHSVQPPYNLFEREAESGVRPYAAPHEIGHEVRVWNRSVDNAYAARAAGARWTPTLGELVNDSEVIISFLFGAPIKGSS